MSKQSEAKESQGYIDDAPKCINCRFSKMNESNTRLICTKGVFSVTKRSVCLKEYRPK